MKTERTRGERIHLFLLPFSEQCGIGMADFPSFTFQIIGLTIHYFGFLAFPSFPFLSLFLFESQERNKLKGVGRAGMWFLLLLLLFGIHYLLRSSARLLKTQPEEHPYPPTHLQYSNFTTYSLNTMWVETVSNVPNVQVRLK